MGRGERGRKRRVLFAAQRGKCALCGSLMLLDTSGLTELLPVMASIDHIKRVRDGGSDVLFNLRATHGKCNQERN